jgi:hypothetical protein
MVCAIERGSASAVGGLGDEAAQLSAAPQTTNPPASPLEVDPIALVHRRGRGAVHFAMPLNCLVAVQAVADHHGISVSALFRLALERFLEQDAEIPALITETIRAGNSRIRPRGWAQKVATPVGEG